MKYLGKLRNVLCREDEISNFSTQKLFQIQEQDMLVFSKEVRYLRTISNTFYFEYLMTLIIYFISNRADYLAFYDIFHLHFSFIVFKHNCSTITVKRYLLP